MAFRQTRDVEDLQHDWRAIVRMRLWPSFPGRFDARIQIVATKVRDIIRLIEEDGWRPHSQKGSHQQYVHPNKPGRVTVAGKPSHDMHPKTLAAILRQAGIKRGHLK